MTDNIVSVKLDLSLLICGITVIEGATFFDGTLFNVDMCCSDLHGYSARNKTFFDASLCALKVYRIVTSSFALMASLWRWLTKKAPEQQVSIRTELPSHCFIFRLNCLSMETLDDNRYTHVHRCRCQCLSVYNTFVILEFNVFSEQSEATLRFHLRRFTFYLLRQKIKDVWFTCRVRGKSLFLHRERQ